VTVRVDLRGANPATLAELTDLNFIQPSAMIDTSDEAVRSIAVAALGDLFLSPHGPRANADVYARARKLRDAVKAHITTFNLKTGYASASETARRGEGDCSEHAVLLAALLRVDGIPSRVCSGIVYTERAAHSYLQSGSDDAGRTGRPGVVGSFAWHAWSQAMIGGNWVDLDATLHTSAYSVGHVLMGTSGMDDGAGHSDEMVMVSMIGNLEMEVDSVA
jgi:transglutaminase-like putative cysteine protease